VPLWRWFSFLSETTSGFLLLETDAGIVTLNPVAARERIVFERMMARLCVASQVLLIPETVHLPPAASARLRTCRAELEAIGFSLDEFGPDVWKVDAVPDLLTDLPVADLLATIAGDIAEAGTKRGGERWREEIIAKSVARSYAGASRKITREGAIKLVEELAATRQPYVCPRGKPIMIFTSNRELDRKFNR
jgi:DNA mismatch repair protein MutL